MTGGMESDRAGFRGLRLYNTLAREKQDFIPIDPANVRIYVCGPTVYDDPHIGNARPMIVFDLLFRLLRRLYGADAVTYVRNITDVDDKINMRAAARGISIQDLTSGTIRRFHAVAARLSCLPPTHEPAATDHIVQMAVMIERLIARGHAYVAEDHVLFDVASDPEYGHLSRRSLDEMRAGARVEVAPYKKGPMDFVLWKPSKSGEPAWPSPAGIATPGRPGWHIECSAMARAYLGDTFDIHGGGIDLVFPHHENEIAQSTCAHGMTAMAHYWLHNGFVQVEGSKMAKSAGNFVTVWDLLETNAFHDQRWHGGVLRLAMLMTHYRSPMDWTADRLAEARKTLTDWIEVARGDEGGSVPKALIDALKDDLNTPKAIAGLHGLFQKGKARLDGEARASLGAALVFLGLWDGKEEVSAVGGYGAGAKVSTPDDISYIEQLIRERLAVRKAKDFAEADRIRDKLAEMGVSLRDKIDPKTGEPDTEWHL